jgi:hypothetical protein
MVDHIIASVPLDHAIRTSAAVAYPPCPGANQYESILSFQLVLLILTVM